ncbi:MAG: hypothetical protein ACLFQO_15540 [Cyclobacteriaceae bacterium]
MENLVELNERELGVIEGGWWLPIIAAYVLLEAALNPSAHVEAFMDGFNSGREAAR